MGDCGSGMVVYGIRGLRFRDIYRTLKETIIKIFFSKLELSKYYLSIYLRLISINQTSKKLKNLRSFDFFFGTFKESRIIRLHLGIKKRIGYWFWIGAAKFWFFFWDLMTRKLLEKLQDQIKIWKWWSSISNDLFLKKRGRVYS